MANNKGKKYNYKDRAEMEERCKRNTAQYRFGADLAQPGDNTKFLSHAMTVMAMPRIDIKDPKQVEKRINDYMVLCIQDDCKPTVKGFCNALHIERSTLNDWRRGKYRASTHQEIVLRGYDMLEALWEDYMANGKINPVSGIFLGKNNFGYTDRQEIHVNASNQEPVDVESIENKYAELPESEVVDSDPNDADNASDYKTYSDYKTPSDYEKV